MIAGNLKRRAATEVVVICVGICLVWLGQVAPAADNTWTGGGGSASWGDAGNFSDGLPDGGADVKIGSGFASGTTLTLDGDTSIDTLEFTAGSDGVNVTIDAGTPGSSFLFPQNRGDGTDASLQMNSSSHHTINALVRFAGNSGQESRYLGAGGGVLTLAGGVDAVANGKLDVKTTNNTVIEFAGPYSGSSRIALFDGSLARTGDSSHITSGQIELTGGTLELTGNTGFDTRFVYDDPAATGTERIRINNGGGLAAVGSDVTVDFGDTGWRIQLNDINLGSVHADSTLTLRNGIQRPNQAVRIRTVDGPVDVEAILTAELGRGDRVEFNGNGAVQVDGKISSRDPIEVNGGALILGASAETANNGGTVQAGKTIRLNSRASAGSDGDAALLLSGVQSRGSFIEVRNTATGSATLGGFSADASSFTNTVDLDANDVNLHARHAGTTVSFSGDIRGTGGVAVNGGFLGFGTGLGTVVLDGNKTYSGATAVKAGTLQVASTVTSLGTSGIAVEDGAVLDNRGDLSGTPTTVQGGGLATGDGTYGVLTVQSGGAVNAGTSPGTMPIATLNMDAGSIFEIELDDLTGQPTAGAGTGWDFYDVAGDLNLPGNGDTVFVDLLLGSPSFLDNDFTIQFAEAGLSVNNFGTTAFSVRDGLGSAIEGASVSLDGNMLFVDFASEVQESVPEPCTLALAILGFFGMGYHGRRRRR